jgi:sn-glycerol 3-phosphate transport system substrate-binding protein
MVSKRHCSVINVECAPVLRRNETGAYPARDLPLHRRLGAVLRRTIPTHRPDYLTPTSRSGTKPIMWKLVTLIVAALSFGLAAPAAAQVELRWWHAMTGGNNDMIVKIASDFNASQSAYKIVPTYKGSYADTMNSGISAFRAGNAPHIMQVFEVGTASMMAARTAVKPVHQLMREAGEPFDPNAYLPAVASYYSTSAGEMLSFPFNTSSMVMWINTDAFRRAGLDADRPPKTWPEVFEAAKKLKASGSTTCGFSTAWATWANLEQFSAWHNLPLATKANGLDGFDAELTFNGPIQIRHLENLAELQKDKTYDYSGRTNAGESRFTSGECPIFLSSSSLYGSLRRGAKFEWAAAPMPYYPDVPGAPQNSIIGGASLWAMGGKTPEEYRGVAKFFAFLSQTDRQAQLHRESGYLPITRAAYAESQATGFYDRHPYLKVALVSLTSKEPTENSRGLRLGNMVQLRDIWAEEIEAALSGQKSAREALDNAVARGNQMLRQFERRANR